MISKSSSIDAGECHVTRATLLKVYAWYNNEAGHAGRMVDLTNVEERGL